MTGVAFGSRMKTFNNEERMFEMCIIAIGIALQAGVIGSTTIILRSAEFADSKFAV